MTSKRTQLKRIPARGTTDRKVANAIVDSARICHIGFVHQEHPFVIPTIHTRVKNMLYIHGAPASRMLKTLREGVRACVTITLVDGLVLAKSAFHHSMNYRSMMVLGVLKAVTETKEKEAALLSFVRDVAPGREEDCRAPNAKELASTSVLKIPIEEFSVKIRQGPPKDDDEDLLLPHWTGVVPLRESSGPLVPVDPNSIVPSYLDSF